MTAFIDVVKKIEAALKRAGISYVDIAFRCYSAGEDASLLSEEEKEILWQGGLFPVGGWEIIVSHMKVDEGGVMWSQQEIIGRGKTFQGAIDNALDNLRKRVGE